MPLAFLLAAASGLLVGRKWSPVDAATEAVRSGLPVAGILVGVGMFIQIMTLSGVRGFFVVSALALPLGYSMSVSRPLCRSSVLFPLTVQQLF